MTPSEISKSGREELVDKFEENFPTKEQVIIFVPVDKKGWDFTRYFEEKLIELILSQEVKVLESVVEWIKERIKKIPLNYPNTEDGNRAKYENSCRIAELSNLQSFLQEEITKIQKI